MHKKRLAVTFPRLSWSGYRRLPIAARVEASALGAGSELVLVFEQDVEGGERSVTARDILLQVELVGWLEVGVKSQHLTFHSLSRGLIRAQRDHK